MSGGHYRTFTPDLQVRSSGDGRTVFGIAVPYNKPTRIHPGLIEQFVPGAFNHQLGAPQRVRFSREHAELGGHIIGAATKLQDDAAGLYVELRASKTPKGDETLELIKDGALSQLSIHFEERQNRTRGSVVERVRAQLKEVAATMEGAYGELAAAAGVRSKVATGGDEDAEDLERYRYLWLPDRKDTDAEIQKISLGLRF